MRLREVLAMLNQMKADGIIYRYAIGGAVGATFYLEPVATLDVHVFIELHAQGGSRLVTLDPIYEYLEKKGASREGEHILIADTPLQFLAPERDSLAAEGLARCAEVDVVGTPARVFRAEYLAGLALETGRAKDKARLLQFMEAEALDMARFREIIARHGLDEKWKRFEEQFPPGER